MVSTRLPILSRLDEQLSTLARTRETMTAVGQLIAISQIDGSGTVRVRGFGDETVEVSGAGILGMNAEDFVGFDVLCLVPTGNVNEALYVLGPISRGGVLFDTLTPGEEASALTTTSARSRPGSSTPAWALDLTPRAGLTGALRIRAISLALDSADLAVPLVEVSGGGMSRTFTIGQLPDVAGLETEDDAMPPIVTLVPDEPFLLPAAEPLHLEARATRLRARDTGSYRTFLTTTTPTGQPLEASASPLPLMRLHGAIAA